MSSPPPCSATARPVQSSPPSGEGPSLGPAGEYTWPDSLGVMGWEVEDDGLKAVFSTSIPSLVASDFQRHPVGLSRAATTSRCDSIDDFACHPGGAKVLDALEDALESSARATLPVAATVLRDYGNMSAATALFVLERMERANRRILMTALGPGFSAAFQLFDGT